jgi:hypothetical protein
VTALGGTGGSRATRRLLRALLGGVVGFLLGTVAMAVVWLVTFARALEGAEPFAVPGFIAVTRADGFAGTELGPLFVFAPVVLGVVAAVVAAALPVRAGGPAGTADVTP